MYRQRVRGRGRARRVEQYRPWNAAALGKLGPDSTYDPTQYELEKFTSLSINDDSMDIDEKSTYDSYDSTNFRPWNAACLNKIDNIERGPSIISTVPGQQDQQSILFPEFNQNDSWYQQTQSQNNLQYSSIMEDLKQLNWEDYARQVMQEEGRTAMEIKRQKQNTVFDRKILDEFDSL